MSDTIATTVVNAAISTATVASAPAAPAAPAADYDTAQADIADVAFAETEVKSFYQGKGNLIVGIVVVAATVIAAFYFHAFGL